MRPSVLTVSSNRPQVRSNRTEYSTRLKPNEAIVDFGNHLINSLDTYGAPTYDNSSLTCTIAQLKSQHSQKIKALLSINSKLTTEIERLKRDSSDHKRSEAFKRVQRELEDYDRIICGLSDKFGEEQVKSVIRCLGPARVEVETRAEMIMTIKEQKSVISLLEKKLNRIQTNLTAAPSNTQTSKSIFSVNSEVSTSIQSMVENLKEEIDNLKAELNSVSIERDTLVRAIETFERKDADFFSKIQKSSQNPKVKELLELVEKLRSENAALIDRNTSDSSALAAANLEINGFKASLESRKNEILNQTKEMKGLEIELEMAMKELKMVTNSSMQREEEMKDSNMSAIEKIKMKFNRENQTLMTECFRYKQEISRLNDVISSKERDIQVIKEEKEDLNHLKDDLSMQLKEINAENMNNLKKIEDFKIIIAEKDENRVNLEKQNLKLTNDLHAQLNDISKKNDTLKEITLLNQTLNTDLQTKNNTIEQLNNQIAQSQLTFELKTTELSTQLQNKDLIIRSLNDQLSNNQARLIDTDEKENDIQIGQPDRQNPSTPKTPNNQTSKSSGTPS